MGRELSPEARLPLFALTVVLAAALLGALFLLDPALHARDPRRELAAPPPIISGGPGFARVSPHDRSPRAAVRVGRRFLRLYARLQTTPANAPARRELRALASLVLAQTLLAQPPQPGGGHARVSLLRARFEPLSDSAVRFHATLRRGSASLRVRCLVQLDRGAWTVTSLAATA
jgi:hypothetical protein